MTDGPGDAVARTLRTRELPAGFDRWHLAVAPGAERPTDAAEWAGALVLVERGTLEVECLAGGRRTFAAGDVLALGWLPLRTLRSAGREPVVLVAVRRRRHVPRGEFLDSLRSGIIASRKGVDDVKFRTTIRATGANTTGIPVPAETLAALGAGRRPAVRVRVAGHEYRSTIGTLDGGPMISLSADNRQKAGLAAGDEVDVELELDSAPREVAVPADFAAALDARPPARRTFEAASYSNKRWHVEAIAGARSDEARQRRIAKSVAMLAEGRVR